MKTSEDLKGLLRSIDHKSYPAYKSAAGVYGFGNYVLSIDHVQGDPFASPSAVHVEMGLVRAGIPEVYYREKCSRIALQDYLTRTAGKQFDSYNFKAKGSGKSGLMSMSRCGQEVLERSACEITDRSIILRFHIGFPAFGRTINSGELEKMLFDFLPECIQNSLCWEYLDHDAVRDAVWLSEDQNTLRSILKDEGLTAFVADGSVLPRKSGVSDLPMKGSVPFMSPDSLRRTFTLPHRGKISGMALPRGITLIVGGGYHGKSTLLEALQNGVYDHIAGDGREFVITDDTAIKLRAEDGRSIMGTDISMFINELPNGKDTRHFYTEDSSGSTSQAAGVAEGIEAGTGLFLIDEDTSATNFMVRDSLMQQVVCRDKEPITPFIERIRDMYTGAGISTVLVAGSSGAFFYTADVIIQMDNYHAVDITEKVRRLCEENPVPEAEVSAFKLPDVNRRWKAPAKGGTSGAGSFAGRHEGYDDKGREHMKVKTFGVDSLSVGKENVDVRYIEQLNDPEQTAALACLLRCALENTGKFATTGAAAEYLWNLMETEGFRPLCGRYIESGFARPRKQEIYAVLNRYRG